MDELRNQRPVARYGFEQRSDQAVTVVIPRFPDNFIGRQFARIAVQTEDKLDLDEIGSLVYPLCDGEHTVAEIAAALKERFGEKVEPLEPRLAVFIQEMFKRNLILFARPPEESIPKKKTIQ